MQALARFVEAAELPYCNPRPRMSQFHNLHPCLRIKQNASVIFK